MNFPCRLGLALGVVLAPAAATLASARHDPSPRPGHRCAQEAQEASKSSEEAEQVKKAWLLAREDNYCAAIELLQGLVKRNPGCAEGWFALGFCLQRAGELEDALTAHVRAAGFPTTQGKGMYNAACACAQLGRIDEAIEWLKSAKEVGFYNLELLAYDPDLDPLRNDERFRAFFPESTPQGFLEDDVRVLYTLEGENTGDQFGWEGRPAGDVDGDGKQDFVVSAPYWGCETTETGPNAGKVYVYSGATGKLLFARTGKPDECLGIGLDTAGDLNGDGRDDVLVGATNWGKGRGHALVLSGKDGTTLLEVSSNETEDSFGWKVAHAGDLNGDGKSDYLIGAPSSDAGGEDAGRVYLFSGANGELLWKMDGEESGDGLGGSVAAGSSKGEALIVVGAGNAGPKNHGRVYVYRVVEGELRHAFTKDADDTGSNLGHMFVSIPGDVNGDGTLDVYASDWQNCARGRCTGRIYVYSGKDGEPLLTLTGESGGDAFGVGPAAAGDVDKDGCADLIVGAWKNGEGGPRAGKCYLYSGRAGKLLRTYVCRVPYTTFGFDATGLGDLDDDGAPDFLITGAWHSNSSGRKVGSAFVVAGPRLEKRAIEASARVDDE